MRAAVLIGLGAAFAASLALAAGGTGRNQYKWRDAEGALHYSDSLPPEAVKFGYEVVNGQGLVVKRVERAKTPEELAAAKAEAAKAAADRAIAEQRARDDQQLLSMYADEGALLKVHQQQLDAVDQEIKTAKFGLLSQEQSLADLLDRAAEAERTGKPLPALQTSHITTLRKQIEEQQATIARREQERTLTVRQLSAELDRYRLLKEQKAAAHSTP